MLTVGHQDSSIVDEYVDTTESLECTFYHRLNLSLGSYIGLHKNSFATHLSNCLKRRFSPGATYLSQRDARPFLCETPGDGLPDSRSCSGHNRDLVFQPQRSSCGSEFRQTISSRQPGSRIRIRWLLDSCGVRYKHSSMRNYHLSRKHLFLTQVYRSRLKQKPISPRQTMRHS